MNELSLLCKKILIVKTIFLLLLSFLSGIGLASLLRPHPKVVCFIVGCILPLTAYYLKLNLDFTKIKKGFVLELKPIKANNKNCEDR
jgi:hypothetical protein